jgi:tRNA pseudouridine55 synthase
MREELNGIVVLDKPADLSSAKAVAKVKNLFKVAKAGHSGTLDPFATGVLVCCLNQATRLARFFLHGSKTYEAVLRLGIDTDTQDATGQIVSRAAVPQLPHSRVNEIMRQFEGQLMQTPPIYSALKHQGTPLYKLARQGKPVQKPPREVTITRIRLLEICMPDIHMEVTCSAGTYIRTLCADIGKAAGCGGHLAALRRTASSNFTINRAICLSSLEEMDPDTLRSRAITSMTEALVDMPTFHAHDELVQRVSRGQRLTSSDIPLSAIVSALPQPSIDHIKVVDGQNRLKAVISPSQTISGYNYCCVFN